MRIYTLMFVVSTHRSNAGILVSIHLREGSLIVARQSGVLYLLLQLEDFENNDGSAAPR